MSAENLDIPKQLIEAYNRRDFEAFLDFLDYDVEWIPIMAALEGRVYCGHAGVRDWIDDITKDWEHFEPCYEEFHDLGDRVLIFGHWHAKARLSGLEFDNQPATWLYEIKAGKVVWMRTFTDRGDALEAAGLSE
jgi:ketosteroid isomerase-like protein